MLRVPLNLLVEDGPVARLTRVLGVVVLLLGVSAWLGMRQFAGPQNEGVMEQLIAGRQIAMGQGYTTIAQHPQAIATLRANEQPARPNGPIPELYHAPLYSYVIGMPLRFLPTSIKSKVFAPDASRPYQDGYRGDYYVFAINLLCFWISVGLVAYLGARFFNWGVGALAAIATFVTFGIWRSVLEVDGGSLVMLLLLVAVAVWDRMHATRERIVSSGKGGMVLWIWSGVLGAVLGLIYLADYTLALLVPVFVIYLLTTRRSGPVWAPLIFVLWFWMMPAGVWTLRNMDLTGSPFGLAGQAMRMERVDTESSLAVAKEQLVSDLDQVSFRELLGKGFAEARLNLSERLWREGAFLFGAFFVVSLFHRYRREQTRTMQWIVALIAAVLLLSEGFFSDGHRVRYVAASLAPLLVIFGVGFAALVVQGRKVRTPLELGLVVALLLTVQGIGVLGTIVASQRFPFNGDTHPPLLYAQLGTQMASQMQSAGAGVMSSSPAGFAWYSGLPVRGQPATYRDFVELRLDQEVGAFHLGANRFERSVASLIATGASSEPSWESLYLGVVRNQVPAFFPLNRTAQLAANHVLLYR